VCVCVYVPLSVINCDSNFTHIMSR